MLKDKRVTLFITGGIAVYKTADLARKFIKAGAQVRVAMTPSACEFVTPLTFQILTKHMVYVDTFDEKDAENVSHIHLADWTELAVVVPATANIIAKMANGLADDFVSTSLMAVTAPRLIVPAMNEHMWENPATIANIQKLKEYGYEVLEPDTGFLAEGYEGKGRMPEPAHIVETAYQLLLVKADLPLKGKRVLVSAGGTKERIDPVRYITNDSSGKMGYSVARAARDLGAEVTLVSAASLERPFGVEVVPVQSAQEMEQAIMSRFPDQDIIVMAAAVSDYRPKAQAEHKIKKSDEDLVIILEKTTDILAKMGATKTKQFLIGFAAETKDLAMYAQDKLNRKNADMIVANDVSKAGVGFNADTNEVIIYQPNRQPVPIEKLPKDQVAQEILSEAIKTLNEQQSK